MTAPQRCPAWLISAPASHQGKTTLTAALARYHRDQGRKVIVFKTGPDFLDPMILEAASGHCVHQLDLWMIGEDNCRRMLYQAASNADLILIEGVMGLFDGEPSSADLAELFSIPVVAVIDVHGMAQTVNAVAYGLKNMRSTLPFAGFIANGVAGERHGQMIAQAADLDIYLGAIERSADIALPERHLGLTQAQEIADINCRLDRAAALIKRAGLTMLPLPVSFESPVRSGSRSGPKSGSEVAPLLAGTTIGIARDEAFSFLYEDNLLLLQELGAALHFFSPLHDAKMPNVDSVYLPGGYPELHLRDLAANLSMKSALKDHYQTGRSIYAECGGMLYLLDELKDKKGQSAKMVGLIPGQAAMQERLAALGYQSVNLAKGQLRGHTFHHSKTSLKIEPSFFAERKTDGRPGEPVIRLDRLHASYVHLYFRSNPSAAASLFCRY